MKNPEYLDFSDHLGHGLTENKRQNWYTFGERTRAAQPGLYRVFQSFSSTEIKMLIKNLFGLKG